MSARTLQLAIETQNDPRWVAVVARDPKADGQFYYSVKTTGVYCRPSCAARPARPENVQFHGTRKDAEKAGFRPCKRCKPDQPALAVQHANAVANVCRLIEISETLPNLDVLAAHANLSTYYLHRVFKAVTGLTPKGYATAQRAKRIRSELDRSDTVTHAIFDAGYNSSSRFYEQSSQLLGMTPSSYRAGGINTDIRFAVGECSLGSILVASSDRGVCAILLGDDPDALARDLQDRFPRSNLIGGDSEFEKLVAQVVGFVETPAIGLELPLDVRGTAFQQRVWQALRKIPAGTTVSYTDIAKRIGAPKSVRTVAQACAANAIAVAIPCHRVVRNDGGLSGYRWGVERKRALLEKEAGNPFPLDGRRYRSISEEWLGSHAVILRGYALADETALHTALEKVISRAPYRHMVTPGGFTMSVAMTNCGKYGWVSERSGYRYDPNDPQTGRPWPEMPESFLILARNAAAAAGFDNFNSDVCLVNRYEPGAKLSLHQDKDELDFNQPIVSVSLGVPAIFLFGGLKRKDKPIRVPLAHGDVVVWGGPDRLRYHGIMPLKEDHHPLFGCHRINLTFRKAT